MATNRKLKADLLKKLGITEQALNLRAKQRKLHELPMTTEQAYYTFAHEAGLDLSRYLPPETVVEVRGLVRDLKTAAAGSSTNGGRRSKAARARKQTVVTIGGVNVEKLPGMTAPHTADAKRMAEKAYPALYVFENSARDVIARVLEAAHGPNWWTKAVPKKVREKAEETRKAEEKDAWHGTIRGAREIDYVLLTDLAKIVRARWSDFEGIFPRPSWFEELVSGDMNVPRRVIAHMHPLATDDVRAIETAFRKWAKQLKANADKLP
jgi:hypothetical protein